jgi:hypothetical protein
MMQCLISGVAYHDEAGVNLQKLVERNLSLLSYHG